MAAAETWSGRAGFILAAIGSAVGLGSIWKFPYEVGANGGAAFVLFYIAGLRSTAGRTGGRPRTSSSTTSPRT